jgi:hypothetical protein
MYGMWCGIYCDARWQGRNALLWGKNGNQKVNFDTTTYIDRETTLGEDCYGTAWKTASLRSLWNGNTLHQSRRRKSALL